jgi:short-subunit dehydrogenase
VRAFQTAGWRVSSVGLPGDHADTTAFRTVVSILGDITDKRVRELAVERTLIAYGRIDVLINNAAIGLYASPSTTPQELFMRLIDVNVCAPLALAQLVLPAMRKQASSTIVNVGSVAGTVALPWAAAYSASKAALHAIHDSLRRELHATSVHLMKVAPGIVDTDFRARVLAGEPPRAVRAIRRTVSPDTVAAAILQGIRKRRKTVYVPKIGALFALIGNIAPGVMDHYLANLIAGEASTSSVFETHLRSEKVS